MTDTGAAQKHAEMKKPMYYRNDIFINGMVLWATLTPEMPRFIFLP